MLEYKSDGGIVGEREFPTFCVDSILHDESELCLNGRLQVALPSPTVRICIEAS